MEFQRLEKYARNSKLQAKPTQVTTNYTLHPKYTAQRISLRRMRCLDANPTFNLGQFIRMRLMKTVAYIINDNYGI